MIAKQGNHIQKQYTSECQLLEEGQQERGRFGPYAMFIRLWRIGYWIRTFDLFK